MDSSVNDLFHSLHSARQNAMLNGIPTVVCGSHDSRQCSADGSWSEGWLVFANADDDSPPRVTPGDRILRSALGTEGLSIRANRATFSMKPFGIRSTNGTLVWCDRRGQSHARAIIISFTGKPRMTRTASDGKALRCLDQQ